MRRVVGAFTVLHEDSCMQPHFGHFDLQESFMHSSTPVIDAPHCARQPW